MIVTHPFLFNLIVALFIAFTSGWLVFVIAGRHAVKLKNKMDKLETEKEQLRLHAQELESQLQKGRSLSNTPVIAFTSAVKSGKTNEAGG